MSIIPAEHALKVAIEARLRLHNEFLLKVAESINRASANGCSQVGVVIPEHCTNIEELVDNLKKLGYSASVYSEPGELVKSLNISWRKPGKNG